TIASRRAMVDDIPTNQIAKHASHKCIRGEMPPRRHSGYAYCGCKRVDSDLSELVGILGRYYTCECPTFYGVARRTAIRMAPRSVWPESSGTVSLIRSFSVRH